MVDLLYRMIAIDLDGTLLSPTGTVTQRTRAAIQGALSSGYMVCFATGRNFTESRAILSAVEHFHHAVFVSGAMVMDTRQRVTLHRTLMEPELARQLTRLLESRGHAVHALQDTGHAGIDYLISDNVPLTTATEQWLTMTECEVHRRSDLATFDHQHTMRISMVASSAEIEEAIAALDAQFGSRIVHHHINVPAFGVELLEIFDPAVNKWQGILHVAGRHGINPDQIIAIGDDVNDLPMIKGAGLGVAMGNARPEVRAAARLVINSNGEEGLAQFLEDLVQGQPRVSDPAR